MYWYNRAEHFGETGQALSELAVRERSADEATRRLTNAISGYGDTNARSRVFCQIRLATMTMTVGDPREAAEVGAKAVTAANAIRSRRVTDDLRELRQIAAARADIPEVADLRDRIGALAV